MSAWEDMTEAQRDDANAMAYAHVADALRRYMDDGLDLQGARANLHYQTLADVAECDRYIALGSKARASKSNKQWAAWSQERRKNLSLQAGFIWDAEP